MKKQNSNGFTLVEILLVIITLAIIGAAGLLVAKHFNKVNSKPTSTSNSLKYLTIKQWGVRASYKSTDTLSYVYSSGGNGVVEVISKNLSNNYGCDTGGAGAINRLSPSEIIGLGSTTVAQDAKANPSQYKFLNGYYYSAIQYLPQVCGYVEYTTQGQPLSVGEQAEQSAYMLTQSLIPTLELSPST